MLIERKKKKNHNHTRNNNGKGFEKNSREVALRLCGVKAVLFFTCVTAEKHVRETELFNNSAITVLGSIHESL